MIMGPVGSGKSYACCAEVFLRALKQEPNSENVRKNRFAIVRNSYPELRTTTIKTWQELFPEDRFGPMRWSPPITHHIQLPPRDGAPGVDCEVLFLALDNPRDTRRVLSLELTGAFIDECREIPKAIASAITARVGRFPSASDVECTWRGWMCTNPPDSDHWIHDTFVKEKPGRGKYAWKFFRQPGGMIEGDASDPQATLAAGRHWVPNPNAENINNLIPGYYDQQLGSKGLDWIKCYVGGEFVYVQEGRSVWEEYVDTTMSADHIDIEMNLPIIVGLDFGLTPAATFGQRLPSGRWNVLFEIVSKDMGLERFGQHCSSSSIPSSRISSRRSMGNPAGSNATRYSRSRASTIFGPSALTRSRPLVTISRSAARRAPRRCCALSTASRAYRSRANARNCARRSAAGIISSASPSAVAMTALPTARSRMTRAISATLTAICACPASTAASRAAIVQGSGSSRSLRQRISTYSRKKSRR